MVQDFWTINSMLVFVLKNTWLVNMKNQENMKQCHSTVVLDIAQKTNHLNVSVGMIRKYTMLEDLRTFSFK